MDIQEQFEKETGYKLDNMIMNRELEYYHVYTEWLEAKLTEVIDKHQALTEIYVRS
jgi:hypothetical protein